MSLSPAPIRVLYVEDSSADAELARLHFVMHAPDLQVTHVVTGADCVAAARGGAFDLLLLDFQLADLNAAQVFAQLAAFGRKIPAVVLLNAGQDELAVQALRAGAADYFVKQGDYLTLLPDVLRELAARSAPRPPAPQRLLYLDSDPNEAENTLAQLALEAPHWQLTVVRHSTEALARLLQPQHGFELVLCSVREAGLNALTFLHRLRHAGVGLPFLLLTSPEEEALAHAALQFGACDYLVKRENYLAQLPIALERALERAELAQTNARLHTELTAARASLEEQIRERTAPLERELAERRVTEREAHRNHAQLHALLETWPAPIFVKDTAGRFLLVNRAFEEVFQLPRSAWLGRTDFDLVPPDFAEQCAAVDRQVLTEDCALELEEQGPEACGKHIFRTVKFPLHDETGATYALCGVLTDITEQKRAATALRDAAEFNAQLLAAAQEGIAVFDRDLCFSEWNAWLEQLTGLRAADVRGRPPIQLFPFVDEYLVPELLVRALGGEAVLTPDIPFTPPGTNRIVWTSTRLCPLRDERGEIIGVIAAVRDITERKQAEAEQERLLQREYTERVSAEEASLRVRRLLENLGEAFVALDSRGHGIYVNERATELFSRAEHEFAMQPFWEILPEEAVEIFCDAFVHAQTEQRLHKIVLRLGERSFACRLHPSSEGVSIFFHEVVATATAVAAPVVMETPTDYGLRPLPHTRSCYVCGEANPIGMRLRFATDDRSVFARFRPRPEHIGFLNVVHGGVTATLLDEIMVWACAVATGRFAYCAELSVRYVNPVHPGDDLMATGELVEDRRGKIFLATGELKNASGLVLVTATGKYLPLKGEMKPENIGDLVGEWPGFPNAST